MQSLRYVPLYPHDTNRRILRICDSLQNILNVLRTLWIPYSLIALSNTALFPRVIDQSSMIQFSIERTELSALLVSVFMVELYLSNSDTRKFNCIAVLVLMF